jgi:hypothetical protein
MCGEEKRKEKQKTSYEFEASASICPIKPHLTSSYFRTLPCGLFELLRGVLLDGGGFDTLFDGVIGQWVAPTSFAGLRILSVLYF